MQVDRPEATEAELLVIAESCDAVKLNAAMPTVPVTVLLPYEKSAFAHGAGHVVVVEPSAVDRGVASGTTAGTWSVVLL